MTVAGALFSLLAIFNLVLPISDGEFLDRLALLVYGLAAGVCSMSALALHRQRRMVQRHLDAAHPGLSVPDKPIR
jgi:hypothetical protein